MSTTTRAAAQALWSHVRTGRSGTGAAGWWYRHAATGAGLVGRRTGSAPTMRPSKRRGRAASAAF